MQCALVASDPQYLSLKLSIPGKEVFVICIYASCCSRRRKDLWNALLQPGHNLPARVMGDFNILCSQEEKIGSLPINLNEVVDSNNMMSQASLTDGGYAGSKFTWCNNRLSNKRILQRLDMVLLCPAWMSKFNTSVTHLSRHCSNHALLLISVNDTSYKGSAFRFLNVWTKCRPSPVASEGD